MKNNDIPLTLVTQKQSIPLDDYLTFIKNCAQLGITAIQLREKSLHYDELKQFGKEIQTIIKPYGIPLIVNDNIELAMEIDADGVHLGQSDGSPTIARERLGNDKIIGVSIDSIENLEEANQLHINYVGIGSIFPTSNKHNVKTIWGSDGLKKLAKISKHPIIAIGGINTTNVDEVYTAGANGIAVIGAIHEALDLEDTIKKLLRGRDGYC